MSATHDYIGSLLTTRSKKMTIIDYGCGSGELLHYFPIEKLKKYDGFDVSFDAIDAAKKEFIKDTIFFHHIIKNKIPNFGEASSVDIIVLIGVWQYLTKFEQKNLLIEANRALKRDGRLLLTTTTDHLIYRYMSLYQFFIPHHFTNRSELELLLKSNGFNILISNEKGLLISPLFSGILTLIADSIDRVFFKTRGKIGLFGKVMRKIFEPLLKAEHKLPIDFGHTLFTVSCKRK